jgi:hypothetical protein
VKILMVAVAACTMMTAGGVVEAGSAWQDQVRTYRSYGNHTPYRNYMPDHRPTLKDLREKYGFGRPHQRPDMRNHGYNNGKNNHGVRNGNKNAGSGNGNNNIGNNNGNNNRGNNNGNNNTGNNNGNNNNSSGNGNNLSGSFRGNNN